MIWPPLVDFWTYSCINCQRTLPHVEAWYRDTPRTASSSWACTPRSSPSSTSSPTCGPRPRQLGVRYPVAIDDNYATWNAYGNQYWPADYLIDAQGDVRHVHFGEGDYATTEQLIRQLLAGGPSAACRCRTPADVPDTDPDRAS